MNLTLWWVKPLLIVIAVAAVTGGILWWRHSIQEAAIADTTMKLDAAYAKRDKAAQEAAEAERDRLIEANVKVELAYRDRINEIAQHAEQEKLDAEKTIAALRRDNAAGKLRLRDPGAVSPVNCNNRAPTSLANAPSVGDGSASTELPAAGAGIFSREANEFLISIWSECDAITRQLGDAQAVIQADRLNQP